MPDTNLETRRFGVRPELRAADEGTARDFRGVACVYDHWYDVAGGPERGGWSEMVAPGAGRRTLNASPDVRLLVNHEGLPLARTRSGTLTLTDDDAGLIAVASLDGKSPRVAELASAMDRGDVDEMSFAFRVTRQEWRKDYTERVVREYALDVMGADVSVVTWAANRATVAELRAAAGVPEVRLAGHGVSVQFAVAVREQLRRR